VAVKAVKDPVQARDSDGDAKARVGRVLHDSRLGSGSGVSKCDSRRPAISVNHEVTLNRSLMNASIRPPVTAAEDGPKF
jgi:hypothetical protein